MVLPVRNSRVNIDVLHPELIRRAELLVAEIPGLVVHTGGRPEGWASEPGKPAPRGSQWYLWEGYDKRLPGFNMAAYPAKRYASGWRGSKHMTQDDGFAHAIDWIRPRNVPWPVIHEAAIRYGIKFNLADRRPYPKGYGKWAEDWHCVAELTPGDWLPILDEKHATGVVAGSNAKAANLLGAASAAIVMAAKAANESGFRRGDRGPGVKVIQSLLREAGLRLAADGIFGPHTERMVKQYQRAKGLYPDGIVGPVTWARLEIITRSSI